MSAVQLPNGWRARSYQKDRMNYLFEGGEFPWNKRAFNVWHRRSGKDSCDINTLAVASQLRVGTYWHLLPTLNQGRKVVWNGIDGENRRVINQAFPYEMQEGINENEMLIKLTNGSMYQVVGSDNYDSLVGTNPLGVAFSEWALSVPTSWDFVRPILAENGGFATFNTTPRGKNHAYTQYRMAEESEHWFASTKTVRDTFREDGRPVISEQMIQVEREEGVAEEVIQQEYYCSWEGVNLGSIYGRYLLKFADTHQIVFPEPFDPELPVYTAWDLGRRDICAVWFYQIVMDEIHVVDYREYRQLDVDDVLTGIDPEYDSLAALPYSYGVASLPHDAKARTFATKYTTYERFVANKLTAYVVPMAPVAQGINAVRAMLGRVYFNIGSKHVRKGLDRLASYQYEYDEKLKVFKSEPLHNDASHGADAFRTLAMSVNIVAASTKYRNSTRVRSVQTPMGRALNLNDLFAEREAARANPNRRV